VESKVDDLLRIGVGEGFDQLEHLHLDSQFFPELALQAFREGLPGLALAPGKLPQASQVIPGSALSDQQTSLPEHQARGNLDLRPTGRCRRCWWIIAQCSYR
jgi:hypothetical protein